MFNYFILCIFFVWISQTINLVASDDSVGPSENEVFAQEQKYLADSVTVDDEALSCGQLINSRGFEYEEHFVTTEDGYILTMYRIVNKYAKAARGTKLKPVLLVHGNFLSCACWLFGTPDGHITEWINGIPPNVSTGNLGFALANGEFDVWLGNNRGTAYSTNHTTLNIDSREFWDFSYPDMGLYDDPAMVAYIQDTTKYEKIVYVGYSLGTMQIFTYLSENPSFADNFDLHFALAPIAFYNKIDGLLGLIPHIKGLVPAGDLFEGPFPALLPLVNAELSKICSLPIFSSLCIFINDAIFGPDGGQLNETRYPVLTSHIDRTSIKNVLHLIQSWDSDGLTKYDYGIFENLYRYGSLTPPVYPVANIPSGNLILVSGTNDTIASPGNVEKFRKDLESPPLADIVIPNWNHLDFVFGIEAYKYCHSMIIDILRTYLKDN